MYVAPFSNLSRKSRNHGNWDTELNGKVSRRRNAGPERKAGAGRASPACHRWDTFPAWLLSTSTGKIPERMGMSPACTSTAFPSAPVQKVHPALLFLGTMIRHPKRLSSKHRFRDVNPIWPGTNHSGPRQLRARTCSERNTRTVCLPARALQSELEIGGFGSEGGRQ